MRYLRKYDESVTTIINPYNPPGNIKYGCEDILVDLEDEGFDVEINISGVWSESKRKTKAQIKIVITSGKSGKSISDISFKYSDISETINRLSSYLESEGFSLLNIYGYRNNDTNLKSMDKIIYSSASEYTIRYFEE